MLQTYYRDSIRGGPCKGEKEELKLQMELKLKLKPLEISLELYDGFRLQLSDILYIPSLRRNLISVSWLDDDGYDCHFGNDKYWIVINNKCVGLAFRQDKLYLLSLSENVNAVSTKNENASSSMNATNKRKSAWCIFEIMTLSFRPYFEGENRAID